MTKGNKTKKNCKNTKIMNEIGKNTIEEFTFSAK